MLRNHFHGALALFLVLLAPLVELHTQAHAATESDSAFFETVIRGLLVVDVGTRLEINPMPFEVGGEFPGYRADSSLVAARVAVLRRFGIEPGGPVDTGECPGLFAAQAPTHPGCPAQRTTRMEIGLPRVVPDGVVPSWRRAGRQAGQRASVVIRLNFAHLDTHAGYMTDYDYYLARDDFGWYVVARQPLTIIE